MTTNKNTNNITRMEGDPAPAGCAVRAWYVPPDRAGQMIEVAYGDSRDGLAWRRTTDRSDRTVAYAVADMADCGCADECDCWAPWNRAPRGYGWKAVQ